MKTIKQTGKNVNFTTAMTALFNGDAIRVSGHRGKYWINESTILYNGMENLTFTGLDTPGTIKPIIDHLVGMKSFDTFKQIEQPKATKKDLLNHLFDELGDSNLYNEYEELLESLH